MLSWRQILWVALVVFVASIIVGVSFRVMDERYRADTTIQTQVEVYEDGSFIIEGCVPEMPCDDTTGRRR